MQIDKFCCILYGEAGVGKTPFCGTLEAYAQTSPSLLLDVDQGAISLITVSPQPTVYSVTKWSDVQTIYTLIKKRDWSKLSEFIGAPNKEYKSVVLDSGSELERMLRESIVNDDDRNEGVPGQPHYLRTQLRFSSLFRSFRKLPLSFVMTAGVRDLKDDVSGIIRFFPLFQPGLTRDLIRMSDLVLFQNYALETQGSDRKWVRSLLTQGTQRFIARDRTQKLETPSIKGDKFHWGDLLDKILSK